MEGAIQISAEELSRLPTGSILWRIEFQLEVQVEGIGLEVICKEMLFQRWDQMTLPRKSYWWRREGASTATQCLRLGDERRQQEKLRRNSHWSRRKNRYAWCQRNKKSRFKEKIALSDIAKSSNKIQADAIIRFGDRKLVNDLDKSGVSGETGTESQEISWGEIGVGERGENSKGGVLEKTRGLDGELEWRVWRLNLYP